MTIQEICRSVEDLLRDDKGGTNFSPAARYAVRMLLDYAAQEHEQREKAEDRCVRFQSGVAGLTQTVMKQERTINDLNQQVSFLRMTLYDAGV